MGKVCIFFAEGFEEIEALTVVDLLRRAGIETDMVSVNEELQVTGSHQVTVTMNKIIKEINFDEVDMLVLPGGMPGTQNLEACIPLMEQLEDFYQKKKYISAICAAPRILGDWGMLKGRNACCYPGEEGHLDGATVTRNEVEVSEHIITARGMGCSIPFGLAIVARFLGDEAAINLAKKIVFKQ